MNRYAYVANDPINSADPLGLLQCFVSYSYEYFSTTVDGDDAVGIRVYARQHCFNDGVNIGSRSGTSLLVSVGGDDATPSKPSGPGQMTANQCLRNCYQAALNGYNVTGETRSQRIVNTLEDFSPMTFPRLANGFDEFTKVRRGGPGFVTRNGLQGPVVRGSYGTALKAGAKKMVGGAFGAASLGLALGGLLVQILNPFIGREKFLRDAIDECNSGCRGATRKIESSLFGTADDLRETLRH
jgi:hypothetical protein